MKDHSRTRSKEQLQLLRLLHGELAEDEARRLRDRMAAEPSLAASYRDLAARWRELELQENTTASEAYVERVVRAAAGSNRGRVRWSLAPVWAQASAAVALAAGVALGLGLAAFLPPVESVDAVEVDTTLAESYWSILDESQLASSAGSEEP